MHQRKSNCGKYSDQHNSKVRDVKKKGQCRWQLCRNTTCLGLFFIFLYLSSIPLFQEQKLKDEGNLTYESLPSSHDDAQSICGNLLPGALDAAKVHTTCNAK